MSKWQPIETAPEECLVYLCGDIFHAYMSKNGYWTAADPSGGGVNYLSDKPTHWMPLPEPPK